MGGSSFFVKHEFIFPEKLIILSQYLIHNISEIKKKQKGFKLKSEFLLKKTTTNLLWRGRREFFFKCFWIMFRGPMTGRVLKNRVCFGNMPHVSKAPQKLIIHSVKRFNTQSALPFFSLSPPPHKIKKNPYPFFFLNFCMALVYSKLK